MVEPKVTDWRGCYDEGWQGSGCLLPESFAHPAKFAFGLVVRIVKHGIEQGYFKGGDTIGDPFGGVACGGIVCGYHGLNWVGVELEPRFVEVGQKNLAMHGPRWLAAEQTNRVVLLQGDSRQFAEIVGEHLAGAVTSPPYADTAVGKNSPGIDRRKQYETYRASGGGMSWEAFDAQQERHSGDYGSSVGQIAALKSGSIDAAITSPPYADSVNSQQHGIDRSKSGPWAGNRKLGEGTRHEETLNAQLSYGSREGQIGALPAGAVDGAITSPPFEQQERGAGLAKPEARYIDGTRIGTNCGYQNQATKADNIANESGETYWQAMALVYRQMWLAMKPGAVAAIVVKDYVKDKARVPLCDDTCRLLEASGFDVFERSRCWLVKETREPSLFGGEHVTTTERKSFFRRLAEKKGSPRIDWEEVVWCRKVVS